MKYTKSKDGQERCTIWTALRLSRGEIAAMGGMERIRVALINAQDSALTRLQEELRDEEKNRG